MLILPVCLLCACNTNEADRTEVTYIDKGAKEVLLDIVNTDNHRLVEDEVADFRVVVENNHEIKPYLAEKEGNAYLGFKPALPIDATERETIKSTAKVYWGTKVVAVVESTFKKDSVRLTGNHKILYYSNLQNNISGRAADAPVRLLATADGIYREEEQAKFSVVFHFPSVKMQPVESVDYHVAISGFKGQSIRPIQKALIVAGNPDDTQNVTLAIDGVVHDYYDSEGTLQEPYEIVYEIAGRQLFGNDEKHILKITNSGSCHNNKISACSFDGKQLNPAAVTAKNTLGGEYIRLTIE